MRARGDREAGLGLDDEFQELLSRSPSASLRAGSRSAGEDAGLRDDESKKADANEDNLKCLSQCDMRFWGRAVLAA